MAVDVRTEHQLARVLECNGTAELALKVLSPRAPAVRRAGIVSAAVLPYALDEDQPAAALGVDGVAEPGSREVPARAVLANTPGRCERLVEPSRG